MRKRFLALAIGLFVMVLPVVFVQTQAYGATPLFTYSGDVLPSQDGWSIVNYPGYEAIGAHVENGVLHFTDPYTYGGSAIHYTRQWDVVAGKLNIAEFDIQGKSCGGIGPNDAFACIYFGTSDGNHNMIYTVYPDKIESAYMDNGHYGPDTIGESYAFDTTQAFNTYTAVVVNGRARLTINGLLVMDQPAGRGVYGVKGIEFGAGSSPAFGEAYFDEIRAYRVSQSGWKACVQPPSDMIGWWPGDGNTNDLIGSHHGRLVTGASFTGGKVGQAFSFDGSGGYVRVADRSSLDTPDGFTVDAWINPRSFGGAKVIASKWDDPTGQWSWIFKLHNDGSGRLRIELSRGDHDALGDLGGETVLPLNTWTHVAALYDRTTGAMRLYVNGILDSEGAARFPGTAINNSKADMLIGAVNGQNTPPGEFFDGLIDEVEVFNRALSSEEIRSISSAGSAGKCKHENCHRDRERHGNCHERESQGHSCFRQSRHHADR